MSDMQMRNKLRKITEAVKNGEHIPERSKTIGLRIFFIFAAIGLLGLVALVVALIIHGQWISALITFIIVSLLVYVVYKLVTAKDLEIR